MAKNLLTKIGLSIVLATAPILYSGCMRPTTYEEKQQYLESRMGERDRGAYDPQIIVPLFKIQ